VLDIGESFICAYTEDIKAVVPKIRLEINKRIATTLWTLFNAMKD